MALSSLRKVWRVRLVLSEVADGLLILAFVAVWLTLIDVAETAGSLIQIDQTIYYIVVASVVIVLLRIIIQLLHLRPRDS